MNRPKYKQIQTQNRGLTMTATNHDNQSYNLVKFVQRCQMSLTVVKIDCTFDGQFRSWASFVVVVAVCVGPHNQQ